MLLEWVIFVFFIKFVAISYRFENTTSYPTCLFMFIFFLFYNSSWHMHIFSFNDGQNVIIFIWTSGRSSV